MFIYYCGEYQDTTTNLYYLRARYYDTSTGRFTTADSYSGTISDPVSLHKYLYAHANPVMNSDPTGYFTLFQMSVAISVQNQLRNTYNSAILDGFVGFLDALLGGERDPMALLSTFVEGVNTGFITGAIFCGISAMANMGCKLAKISVMLKVGMAGFGVVGGAISTVQSFQQGKNAQGALRGVITAVGTVGFAKTLGSSIATSKSCERGSKTILALPEPKGTNPWLEGSEIVSMPAPKDCYINMAMAPGQNRPGGWGTFDNISSVDYVRNNLAVTPEFKAEISHVQRYLIPEGTQIQIGAVGPQTFNNILYPGGGNQVQILNFADRANLIPIGDKVNIQ